jgi:hypothetical protein
VVFWFEFAPDVEAELAEAGTGEVGLVTIALPFFEKVQTHLSSHTQPPNVIFQRKSFDGIAAHNRCEGV